jgi:hypothetical protein
MAADQTKTIAFVSGWSSRLRANKEPSIDRFYAQRHGENGWRRFC